MKTNNFCSSANINISKDNQYTLSSFSGVPVTLGLEVREEATKEVAESLTLLSEDLPASFFRRIQIFWITETARVWTNRRSLGKIAEPQSYFYFYIKEDYTAFIAKQTMYFIHKLKS